MPATGQGVVTVEVGGDGAVNLRHTGADPARWARLQKALREVDGPLRLFSLTGVLLGLQRDDLRFFAQWVLAMADRFEAPSLRVGERATGKGQGMGSVRLHDIVRLVIPRWQWRSPWTATGSRHKRPVGQHRGAWGSSASRSASR